MRIYIVVLFCITAFISNIHTVFADDGKSVPLLGNGTQNEYIIKLKNDTAFLASEYPSLEVLMPEINMFYSDDISQINALIVEDAVEYVEPNITAELFTAEYSDTYYSEYQWNFEAVKAADARLITKGSKDVIVGIVDSGLQSELSDLDYSDILNGANFSSYHLTDTFDTDISDNYGHGTAVTGIIKAQTDNSVGIAGIADGVKILPVKAFDGKTGKISNIIAAINYLIDNNCDVINFSAGFSSSSKSLKDVVNLAYSKNIIFVSASGNSSKSVNSSDDALMYPASYPTVISVGSVDKTKTVSYFSQKNECVDVVAPGESILSLKSDVCQISSSYIDDEYTIVKGTSFSCPHVTALAALAKSIDKSITPDEFKNIITSTAVDLGDDGKDNRYGYGLIDMYSALSAVQNSLYTKMEITPPDKTDYISGQPLDLTGLVVKVTLKSGGTDTVSDYTVEYDKNALGTTYVTVKYYGLSDIFTIYVSEKEITDVEFVPPSKTEYIVGETLDTSGIAFIVTYNNGLPPITVYDDFDISEYSINTSGKKTLTVTYNDFTFPLIVNYAPITVISNIADNTAVLKGTAVSLSSNINNCTIYYTLDGSDPNKNSNIYIEPISFNENTVIKAIAYYNGIAGDIATFNYIIKTSPFEITDTLLLDNGILNGIVNVNSIESAKEYKIIIALYNNKNLEYIKISDGTSAVFEFNSLKKTADRYCVYIWDNMTSIIPAVARYMKNIDSI